MIFTALSAFNIFVLLAFAGVSDDSFRAGVVASVAQVQAADGMLMVGEELEYKVSYSFFDLGTIRFQVTDRLVRGNRVVYKATCTMKSNPWIPFVDLHIRFLSEFDESVFSYAWSSLDSSKEKLAVRKLIFDEANRRILREDRTLFSTGARSTRTLDTIPVTGRYQDGLSLFYYARRYVRQEKQENISTVIEKKEESTFFNLMNKVVPAEIDALDYPVETVYFDGEAKFVGVFGMTGGFQGWFSNDVARIPILARLNVILGSVKIQLVRWNRPGWKPLKFSEVRR